MKLLLSISLFFAALIHTCAEVSDDFINCKNFFYNNTIPMGFDGIAKPHLFNPKDLPDGIKDVNDLASPAYICQTYENIAWFATLYDRGRRMPLYSAYIMNGDSNDDCKRLSIYKLEPQLAYRGVDKNMKLRGKAVGVLTDYNRRNQINTKNHKNRPTTLLNVSQAMESQYEKTGYTRGHLNPCGHQTANKTGYNATFTLTNIVPMVPDLNNKIWCQHEKRMVKVLVENNCTKMYVVTGIVPGNVPIKENGLPAPTHVWNAYCCVDNNGKPIVSGAALAENNRTTPTMTEFQDITTFQIKLQGILDRNNTEVFAGGCKPQKVY